MSTESVMRLVGKWQALNDLGRTLLGVIRAGRWALERLRPFAGSAKP